MTFFLKILIVIFSFLIIKSKGEERLAYFYIALFLIPGNISIFPIISFIKGHLLFVTCYVVSLWYHSELIFTYFKKTILFIPLILIYVSYLLIGVVDIRHGVLDGIFQATYRFEESYFTFLIGWLAVGNTSQFSFDKFYRLFLRFSLITTLFGIVTFIIKSNPVLDAIGLVDRFNMSSSDMDIREFRVTSFFISSSVYAFACGCLSFIGVVFLKNKTRLDIIAILLLFVNSMLSGTRAGIIPVLLLYILYFIFNFKHTIVKVGRYIPAVLIFLGIIYIILPNTVGGAISQFSTIIQSVYSEEAQAEVKGSSMAAREMQIGAAMRYLAEKPLFGHGFSYSKEVVGEYGDPELLGMESYLCFLGVEYGGVFIVCILIFFISLFYYYFSFLYVDREVTIVSVSLLFCLILFLIFAWIGDIWLYILPILGFMARYLYDSKYTFSGKK